MINSEILNFVQTAARNTPAPDRFAETFNNVVTRASMDSVIKQRLENQKQVLENQEQVQRQAVEAQRQALEAQRQVPEEIQAAQEGGPIENAETDLETRLGPMGVINDFDGDPGPSLGGEGVADDLTMEVPEGSYILNSDGVSLIGISDINKVIRDAYTIAAALGQELPADYDPQNKVPIRISNGEAVIPAPLVGVIGLDRLERWNEKGLEVRRQREEAEKAQAETQAAQPVTEAPPVQPMQAQMGGMMGYNKGDKVETELLAAPEDDRDLATRIASFFGVEDVPQDILSWFEDNRKDTVPEAILDIPESISDIPESLLDIWKNRDELSGIFDKPYDPYNTKFGEGTFVDTLFTPTGKILEMNLSTVLENQANMIASIESYNKENPTNRQFESAAWGAYQIMPETLEWLINKLKLDPSKTIFTSETQDLLATELLRRRGVFDYITDPTNPSSNLSTIQNNLAKEWRSLPNTDGVSESERQNVGIKYQEFRDILKRVQELGSEKGVKLLLRTIIMAEHAPRKNN